MRHPAATLVIACIALYGSQFLLLRDRDTQTKCNGLAPETTFHCTGPKQASTMSCHFRHLYYSHQTREFVIVGNSDNAQMPIFTRWTVQIGISNSMPFRARHALTWQPACDGTVTKVHGLSLLSGAFLGNIGHALFDGLYPSFMGLMDFNQSHAGFRTVMLYPSNEFDANTIEFALSVYRQASPAGLLFLNELSNDVMFEELVFGDYMRCHWCVSTNQYRMENGYGLQAFRSHMFQSYRLTPPIGLIPRDPNRKLLGILVWNKRFTRADLEILNVFLTKFKNHSESDPLLSFGWVHWSDYTFKQQLQLLADTAIYVSGPGTAIMNQPFLPDGAAVVALGTVEPWIFQRQWYSSWFLSERQMGRHPGFMEQFMSAGVDYTRTLYYPLCNPNSVLDADILLNLVLEASRWVRSDHAMHAPDYRVNLSPDGQIVDELLKRDPTFLAYMRDGQNHPDCGYSPFQWPEIIVRRLGGWGSDAPFFFHKCDMNATVLATIKIEQHFRDDC